MHCYLKPRNGVWYIWEYDESTGQCSKHSARTRDRAKAEQALAKHILSIPTRQQMPDATVLQVLLRYWELHGQHCFGAGTVRLMLGRVADLMPATRVSEFTAAEQEKFTKGLSWATARRYLGQVHTALVWARKRGEIGPVPEKVKVAGNDRAGARPLKVDELRALCEAATHPWQRMFLAIAIATAQRPAHVLELTWDRVDFELGVIDFQDPGRRRTKKVRPTVPMPPTLQAYLLERRSLGPVVQYAGRRLAGHRTMFDKLAAAAKVDGTAYGIRKAAATYMRRNGIPEMDLKGMLGHRLGGMTDRYAHVDPQFMTAARACSEALLREVCPSWLASYFPVPENKKAHELVLQAETGAGKGARTLDLNLGKDCILHIFSVVKAANDD